MSTNSSQGKAARSRRVGRVTVYQRGKVWYLYFFENGRRVRRRVGGSLAEANRVAAQVNVQLATAAPAMLSFQPVSLRELRQRWLDHHEHVLRSSVATIRRYRAATDHLLGFGEGVEPVASADRLTTSLAEAFAQYLRRVQVSPNGHERTPKRGLRDKGVIFILEACRAMFNYAAKHRHLPPYHENPFTQIDVERIPIADAKPVDPFTPKQEADFLTACDDWQFPIFLTMALTGMRPGELVHLLIPDDIDLQQKVLRVRNKLDLGWKTKTRNERDIPICAELSDVLHRVIRGRRTGPLFLRRRFVAGQNVPPLADYSRHQLAAELNRRIEMGGSADPEEWSRSEEARVAKTLWRDAGAIKETVLRVEFIKVTARIGLAHVTCPKILRHLFATCLQDANVDPLIRQELMGHATNVRNGDGLGMTAVYTHTRESTRRSQLEAAIAKRQGPIRAAQLWLRKAPTVVRAQVQAGVRP